MGCKVYFEFVSWSSGSTGWPELAAANGRPSRNWQLQPYESTFAWSIPGAAASNRSARFGYFILNWIVEFVIKSDSVKDKRNKLDLIILISYFLYKNVLFPHKKRAYKYRWVMKRAQESQNSRKSKFWQFTKSEWIGLKGCKPHFDSWWDSNWAFLMKNWISLTSINLKTRKMFRYVKAEQNRICSRWKVSRTVVPMVT